MTYNVFSGTLNPTHSLTHKTIWNISTVVWGSTVWFHQFLAEINNNTISLTALYPGQPRWAGIRKKHNIFNFLHFLRSLHICQGICFYNLTPSFLWPASGSYTFHFKIHARIFSTNKTLKYYLDSIETWWYNVCFWLVFNHILNGLNVPDS